MSIANRDFDGEGLCQICAPKPKSIVRQGPKFGVGRANGKWAIAAKTTNGIRVYEHFYCFPSMASAAASIVSPVSMRVRPERNIETLSEET